MISWLLTSPADHPEGLREEPFPAWLSPAEAEVFLRLKLAKRRQEWLLGRWTAKQVLGQWWAGQTGHRPRPEAWSILADPDGAPGVFLAGEGRAPVSLSISHRAGWAFCALMESGVVGVDLEQIEPRSEAFIRDFFTLQEYQIVQSAAALATTPAPIDALVMLIWSTKEAVLKVARQGLREDTRTVEVLPTWPPALLSTLSEITTWQPVPVRCALPGLTGVRAWWRVVDQYILTVAAVGDQHFRR